MRIANHIWQIIMCTATRHIDNFVQLENTKLSSFMLKFLLLT